MSIFNYNFAKAELPLNRLQASNTENE